MRPPELRIASDEMIVDCFAGGGGASLGIELALGRSPDIAINHDSEAIAMHQANHPRTQHFIEDIFDVDPAVVCKDRKVGLAWFSPDCSEHSRAKNGALVRDKKVRCLANVVHRWAAAVRPRVILLENVEEFQLFGPLDRNGRIIKSRQGEFFRFWWRRLEDMGYRLSMRVLRACDYGAPTSRARLFIIARCDGVDPEACWPEATHGPGRAEPWRTAAECIDYSIPCPSIFMTKEEARAFTRATGIAIKRPLCDKTMQRIRRGIYKYVIGNARPFLVPTNHGGVGRNDNRVHDIAQPMRTITAAHRGEVGLVAPTLVQTGYGERPGQAPRCLDIKAPLGTVIAGGNGHGNGKHALVTAFLEMGFSERQTGGWNGGRSLGEPAGSVTCRDHHHLVTGHMVKLRGTSDAHMDASSLPYETPIPTISANGNHVGEVRAFLSRYNGVGIGQDLVEPMLTVTTKDRFGLVVINGQEYQIVDIGFRMLEPRELFNAQGFPPTYVIYPIVDGKRLSKTGAVEKCGNSVCPPVACALVRSVFAAEATGVIAA